VYIFILSSGKAWAKHMTCRYVWLFPLSMFRRRGFSDGGWYGANILSAKQEEFYCFSIHSAEKQL